MYATGIGLVIEGLGRYYKEMGKDYVKEEVNKVVNKKQRVESRIPGDSVIRPANFLKKIQDFFEKDDV
jgi:hypothetical protein